LPDSASNVPSGAAGEVMKLGIAKKVNVGVNLQTKLFRFIFNLPIATSDLSKLRWVIEIH